MTKIYTLILCLITFIITAQDYYSASENLYGNELRNQLHNLIDGHTIISYSNCISALKQSDKDVNNSNLIHLVYKNTSINNTNFAYDINNPVHLNYWNREHIWAKSLGNFGPGGSFENSPAHTDLHNLKPSDMSINSDRSNKGFDNGGTQHNEAVNCYYTNNSWEAPDNVKGDIARILFYMDIRYDGSNNEPDLNLTEEIDTYPNPQIGVLSTLLEWHINDPVDDFEENRNEVIYQWQNNRNPFIDHPEYVNLIWGEDSVQPTNDTSALIISEYIEGSANNKAIELYNSGNDTLNLSEYKLLKISNGGFWSEEIFDLTGLLAPHQTYIIGHYNASNYIIDLCDLQINLNHNGNDALAISHNGIRIDQIGQDGEAPTDGWTIAGIPKATKDHTLIRKTTINSGNIDWQISAGTQSSNSEWIVLELDDFSNLGIHNSFTVLETQTIELPMGWFLLGLNIEPIQNELSSILETIINDVEIVKDYLGNVYLPEFEFNNIGGFNIEQGYQIKLTNQHTLNITGHTGPTSSAIPEGWFIFTPQTSNLQNIEVLFEDQTTDIVIVKDYLGNVYLPDWEFNGIGNIENGNAYQIKSNADFSINW
jgi:endonuclease I